MIIDNKKQVYQFRTRELFFAILTITLAGLLGTTRLVFPEFLGIARVYWVIAVCLIFVFYFGYHLILNINYIYFTDQGNRIILRYFSNRPFNQAKNSIEIDKKTFVKFETQDYLFGLKTELTLYQNLNQTIAKYPIVSLSGLTKEQKRKLIITLQKYTKKN